MKYIFLALVMLPALAAAAPNFEKAEKEIKFLKPDSVKEFPDKIKKALEASNCMIPTVPGAQGPTGWAKGTFADKEQTDWAVLCSDKFGKSRVEIIWGGKKSPCPNSFGSSSNKTFLQVQDKNTIMFSRMVGSIGPRKVISYMKKVNHPLSQKFSQDGIVDSFIGKASTVHFCTAGKWQKIPGAD